MCACMCDIHVHLCVMCDMDSVCARVMYTCLCISTLHWCVCACVMWMCVYYHSSITKYISAIIVTGKIDCER